MRTALSAVLLDVPRAAAIWLSLLGVVTLAVSGLLLRPRRLRFDAGARIREAALPSKSEQPARQRDQDRWAEEVTVAAERAETTARRQRDDWLAAQDEAEQAWQAYEAAEADVRRLSDAAGLPLPQTPRTPTEYADRERWLHRAALDAYWRRELSVEQLSDVFAHRGWDPRLHPVEQELVLRRAVRDHLFAQQRAAREREQEAWRAAEVAAASARSLRAETVSALLPAAEQHESVLPLTAFGEVEQAASGGVEQTREIPTVAVGRAPVAAY
ncbi:hypothetical protein E0H26_03310 [Micromonospora zingiberis]|uniref:AP2/ERF domain-containing protein n=2 Tax=Micromonospora zingiberis TaxID=2053011 RepID=A0A4R0GUI8_9ACTN|nr:hypothetical protein E0H26_03310 [Micromonospora zingiberis]